MKIRVFIGSLLFVACYSLFFSPASVFAHVVVKPSQVGVGAFQTFTVGVPNEKENPTVGVRLVIPAGLEHVTPNVKPGWNVEVIKTGEGEEAKVKEILWTGGLIPAGQRDEFNFSAKVPSSPTDINWSAYQTYQNGDVVAWDQAPSEKEGSTPYSTTQVIDDLSPAKEAPQNNSDFLNITALALAAAALAIAIRKK